MYYNRKRPIVKEKPQKIPQNTHAPRGRTAIILDPSVAGDDFTRDEEEKTWSTVFSYGTISGIASCNSIEGTYANAYSGNQNNIKPEYQNGQLNCWCRMTSPVRSAWVFNTVRETASDCASRCANLCSYYIRINSEFRAGVFGAAGN